MLSLRSVSQDHITDCKLDSVVYAGVCVASKFAPVFFGPNDGQFFGCQATNSASSMGHETEKECTGLTDGGYSRGIVGAVGDSRQIGIKCVWVEHGQINEYVKLILLSGV